MNIKFSKAAELEFKDAIAYYNDESEGLGFEFANEVKLTIDRITGFVDAWPKLSENTRRARTNRFPYGIIYSNTQDEIMIVAVMHLHRKPDYWKFRITKK
jgi:plasmid stabilization system protein ParE